MNSKDDQKNDNNSASEKKLRAKKRPLDTQASENFEGVLPDSTIIEPVPEDQLGQRIIERRKTKQFSQEALAVMTRLVDPHKKGISRPTIVSYEKGATLPSARELRLLADALQVTPSWLVMGKYDEVGIEGLEQGFLKLFKEMARFSIQTELQDHFSGIRQGLSSDTRWQWENMARSEGADITKKRNQ